MFLRAKHTKAMKCITVCNQDGVLYEGKWEELPFDEKIILEYSIRFFDDPAPCYIHRGAVRVRLLAELEECYEASQNGAGGSRWRDTLARYMGVPTVTTAEFTQL